MPAKRATTPRRPKPGASIAIKIALPKGAALLLGSAARSTGLTLPEYCERALCSRAKVYAGSRMALGV